MAHRRTTVRLGHKRCWRRWTLALRMARRDLRMHGVRSALTMFLVALPVSAAVQVALVQHNTRDDGERLARELIGAADGLLVVTEFPRI